MMKIQRRMAIRLRFPTGVCVVAGIALASISSDSPVKAAGSPEGWSFHAPRDEIAPVFTYKPNGGPATNGAFVIASDGREGLIGYWTKTIPVLGGDHYRFAAFRRTECVVSPRLCAVARIFWEDGQGRSVVRDAPTRASYGPRTAPKAEQELPRDRGEDAQGWTEVSDVYRAPSRASQAVIELGFRWAAGGNVEWSDVSLVKVRPPASRTVRLATVHFRPQDGKTNAQKCQLFAPLVGVAALA